MIHALIDGIQTVCITMAVGFVMGLISILYRWWRGEDF